MNEELSTTDFDELEAPLREAVEAVLATPIPDDSVERVNARAKGLADGVGGESRTPICARKAGRALRWLAIGVAAVAVLLAAVAGGLWLFDSAGGRAFAQMVEKVTAARSVRFNTSTRFGAQEIHGVMYLEGSRMRLEQFEGRVIVTGDLGRKEAMLLDTQRKLAQPMPIDAAIGRACPNPLDQLRYATAKDAKPIGEEMIDGRPMKLFRLAKIDLLGVQGNADNLVWVDIATRLPAKIVIRDPDPKSPTEFRFEKFVWNESLSPSLFSLSVPAGYQAGVVARTPRRGEPLPAPQEEPTYRKDGVLSRDRVPAFLLWDQGGTTITALMRDPESTPAESHRTNEIRQWDVTSGKLRWSSASPIQWLAGTADGKQLATAIGYELQLRDAATGKATRKWATTEPVLPLAVSPDGKTLAAGIARWGRFGGGGGNPSGGVELWDVERRARLHLVPDEKPVTFVRFSADGKYVASSSNPGPVKLWEVSTGRLERLFTARFPVAFSPEGKRIACTAAGRTGEKTVGRVDLYDLKDGAIAKSFASAEGPAASWLLDLAFSGDGRLLAGVDWNGTVTLWDVATGSRRQTMTDHRGGVLSVAFAPNGAALVTGSEDRTLRVRRLAELVEAKGDGKRGDASPPASSFRTQVDTKSGDKSPHAK